MDAFTIDRIEVGPLKISYRLVLTVLLTVLIVHPVLGQPDVESNLKGPFFQAEVGLGGSTQNQGGLNYENGVGYGLTGGYSFGRYAVFGSFNRAGLRTEVPPGFFAIDSGEYSITQYYLGGRIQISDVSQQYPDLVPFLDLGIALMRSEYQVLGQTATLNGSGLMMGFGTHYFVDDQVALTGAFTAILGAYSSISIDNSTADFNESVNAYPAYLTVGISVFPTR